ncbi:MAG: TMEM143 family protein [Gammaproteobacteria bacterium]
MPKLSEQPTSPVSRLRFIPFRKKDVISMCLASGELGDESQARFRTFTDLLKSVFHFEYHDKLETLKDLYAPINPDRDTRVVSVAEADQGSFAVALDEVLDKANYERLDQRALMAAFDESSLFQLKLNVNFDDYAEVMLYTRGESQVTETVKAVFGLVKKEVTFINYDRVVLYVRMKEHVASELSAGKPGVTLLKLFQNVPRADVEMLFPGTRLGMRTIDKFMIGVPALIGAGAIVMTNAGASLLLLVAFLGFYLGLSSEAIELDEARLLAILAGLGGLGSYIWKQYSNFKNRKLLFMQSLTRSLYFKNLDNNAGVFYRLVDDAEEEECKEAILAYYFLRQRSAGLSAAELDDEVEAWFREKWQMEIDFEVDDGLNKLTRLGLAQEREGRYSVVDLDEACRLLDERWDNYFSATSREA